MKSRAFLESAGTTTLVIIALLMFAMYISDRIISDEVPDRSNPLFIARWEEHAAHGVWRGVSDPEWVVMEFMDFTCPYCAQLSAVTDSLLSEFPDRLAVVTMYFPLGDRELALEAAKAAECARAQDRFHEMYQTLFFNAEEIGAQSWRHFAERSSVPDLLQFSSCMNRNLDDFEKVINGRLIGQSNGVVGTPTVWLNGTLSSSRTVQDFRNVFLDPP